ncbi:2-methylcitrate dehydratase [Kockovaella imperatae]|uniref:2-methylcitrate dehydratase n=1 Tax=Kockovaella imperatae TaxID=4999 RepID=A0A1Y1UNJ8_9TREE|nr:2-methylcitrate dehydratase [Kockovaella imperatae]ORX39589.1 2-methylcitrate dehydratase [Kockovaella imperatae]
MATQRLAAWATSLRPESLPEGVKNAAARSLYNYVGCAIGGSKHPTATKAYDAMTPFFGQPTSTLLGQRRKVDAQHAALINGIASHVHDYDDTHLETIIHPTGPVASALLAFVEYRPKSTAGTEVLCALVAGIEAACKLGLSVWPHHYDIGWHITSSTGSIGAAVAVGKMLELDTEAMAHAIGIAAVQSTGMREMFGSDTKSFHVGRAAQNGLLAAMLASKGFTSSLSALEAKRGWANIVAGGGTPRLDHYIDQLGSIWEIEKNAFKPFPCGIVCHPAIDGCIQLHHELAEKGIKIDDIVKVEEKVHPLVIELTSKRTPSDGLEAKFSVFHGSAVGLLLGKAGPAQYEDSVVRDQAVIFLRDLIDAHSDETLMADETYLTVHLKDGSTLEKHIEHAVGSLEVPMTDQQLIDKFIDQCSAVVGSDKVKGVSDALWRLGDSEDVKQILQGM